MIMKCYIYENIREIAKLYFETHIATFMGISKKLLLTESALFPGKSTKLLLLV